MAITRCPYCHAIIDENDKYCNNCGTQLLFTEDEDVEEEIPGEKIIDADVEEKDYTVDEPGGEKKPTDIIELAEDLEEELEEETEELALAKLVEENAGEDDVTEEVILIEEIEAAEAANKAKREESKKKAETAEIGRTEEDEGEEEKGDEGEAKEEEEPEKKEYAAVHSLRDPTPADNTEEPPAPSEVEPVIEYLTEDKDREQAETAEEAVPQPVTFDTRELEGLGKTIELGKDKIDKLLEVLAEKRAEPEPPPKRIQEPTGTLPPWANIMKGAPVFSEESVKPETGEEGSEGTPPTAADEEVEIFPRRRDSDSTVGLPERVSQSPLPFERGESEADEEGEEAEAGREEREEEKALPAPPSLREREAVRPAREPERRPLDVEEMLEEARPRPPFSFSVFFKSKAFDLLFVGLFWLVALWLAAHSMDLTLFEILGAMSGSMFLLYIVFAFIYFFLFKFFLGETLGDRLFRERE